MSSLDVLDYQVGLDEALARPGPDGRPLLEAPYRKQALRELKRLVEAMAFRYAILDERPLPEDLDYLRAIEGLKTPALAAPVFARRRPFYAKTRRRRLATTFVTLGILATLVAVLAIFAVSEKADTILDVRTSQSQSFTFTVPANVTRLYVAGNMIAGRDGSVDVFLTPPGGGPSIHVWPAGDARDNYLRTNLPSPAAGEWTALIDIGGAGGSASLTINAVTPR